MTLKRWLTLCTCVVMAVAIAACGSVDTVIDDIKHNNLVIREKLGKLKGYELADLVNIHGISLTLDGKPVLEDRKDGEVYMNDDPHLLIDVNLIRSLFHVTVNSLHGDEALIMDRGRRYTCPLYTDKNQPNKYYVAVGDVCDVLGYGYTFDWDNVQAVLHSPEPGDELPAYYDLRNDDRMPAVKSQGSLGTCWAFASLAALESTLMPEEKETFSVDHMTMNSGFYVDQYSGGDFFISLSYLASWKGPVYEKDDPYGDGYSEPDLKAVKHLQDAIKIKAKDYTLIKRLIMACGAVQSSYYSDVEYSNEGSTYYNLEHASYHYDGAESANHDAVIIGWDDSFPKEYFNVMPEHDGAFICQNSWGADFGDKGYFYVSYEDTNIGTYNMCYVRVDDVDNYDHIYQTDMTGWVGSVGYEGSDTWFANVYHTDTLQLLCAASFYATAEDTCYRLYVVPDYKGVDDLQNGQLVCSGFISDVGYYTLDIDQEIPVSGDFAVVMCIEQNDAEHPVAVEYKNPEVEADIDISDGEGYLSSDGKNWQSAEEQYDCNVCLKAFTKDID